jgi:hypothetical protein
MSVRSVKVKSERIAAANVNARSGAQDINAGEVAEEGGNAEAIEMELKKNVKEDDIYEKGISYILLYMYICKCIYGSVKL